jgi:hypothetical protein
VAVLAQRNGIGHKKMSKFKALLFFTTLLLISALLLIAINQTQKKLDRSIRQHNLYFTGQIYNAPPIVVFTTVALGSSG